MSNRSNKMLLHSKHITYILLVQKLVGSHMSNMPYCTLSIPMVQKLLVCTSQPCQIKLVGVGHCFAWQVTHPSRLMQSMSAPVGDSDPYPQVFQFQNAILGSMWVSTG